MVIKKMRIKQRNSSNGYDVLHPETTAEQVLLPGGGTVATQLEGVVNVKSFGAIGDGIADDTVALAQAVSTITANGGGILYFPKGTYINEGVLSIPSNTTVQGAGIGVTIIKIKDSATRTRTFFLGQGTSRVTISDLSIDGNKTTQVNADYAIIGFKASYCKLENVRITNQNGIGVGWSNCHDMTCKSVEVSYCGDRKAGFWCEYDDNTVPWNTGYHIYENCDSYYNDLDGFIINCPNTTVLNCRANNNGQNVGTGGALGAGGFYNDRDQKNIKLINCEFNNNTEFGINGIFLNALISGCEVTGNGLSGINLRIGSKRIKISDCSCRSNGKNPTTSNPTSWGKSGIQYNGVSFVSIIGCGCYDDATTPTQKYGIQSMGTTASNFVVAMGNNLKYNVTDDSNIGPGHSGHNTANLTFANNI